MGIGFTVVAENLTLTDAAVTRLQIAAASDHPVYIRRIEITGDGISATETKMDVRLQHQDADGTGTSVTPQKRDKDSGSINATAKKQFSAEPGNKVELYAWKVHPQGGMSWTPPGAIKIQPGQAIGLEVQHADTADVDINFDCEEV